VVDRLITASEALADAGIRQACRTCGEGKPLSEYWRQPSKKNGRQSECKLCMRARTTRWFRTNAEAMRPRNVEATNKSRRERPIKALLRAIKSRAKARGLEFDLREEDIIVPEFCPVLGIRLEYGLGHGRGVDLDLRDRAPSVDRVDNTRGYTRDNVVVISYRANRLKSDAKISELRAIADWYDRHEREKNSGGTRNRSTENGGEIIQDQVSEVLAFTKEKERSMPVCEGNR
jgi:hypothetical protein